MVKLKINMAYANLHSSKQNTAMKLFMRLICY